MFITVQNLFQNKKLVLFDFILSIYIESTDDIKNCPIFQTFIPNLVACPSRSIYYSSNWWLKQCESGDWQG